MSVISPKNDVVFKKYFGVEKNKGLLMHFFNIATGLSDDGVSKISTLSICPIQSLHHEEA